MKEQFLARVENIVVNEEIVRNEQFLQDYIIILYLTCMKQMQKITLTT